MSDPKTPNAHPDDNVPGWLQELYEEDQPQSPVALDDRILQAAAAHKPAGRKPRVNPRSWWTGGLASAAAVLLTVGVLFSGEVDDAQLQPEASGTLFMKEHSELGRQRTQPEAEKKQTERPALPEVFKQAEPQAPAPSMPTNKPEFRVKAQVTAGVDDKSAYELPGQTNLAAEGDPADVTHDAVTAQQQRQFEAAREQDSPVAPERQSAEPPAPGAAAASGAFSALRSMQSSAALPSCDSVVQGLCNHGELRAAIHPGCGEPYTLPPVAQEPAELYGAITYRIDQVWYMLDCRGGEWQSSEMSAP